VPAGRGGGRDPGGLGNAQPHPADDETERPGHGQGGARDGTGGAVDGDQPGGSVPDLHLELPQQVTSVALAGGAHGVGDQADAIGPGGIDGHPRDHGPVVDSVADQLAHHAIVGEQHGHGAGFAVVNGMHRGEQVGGDAGPPADGRGRDVLVGVGVPEGHLDARPSEAPGGGFSPVAFDGQGDHAQRRPAH